VSIHFAARGRVNMSLSKLRQLSHKRYNIIFFIHLPTVYILAPNQRVLEPTFCNTIAADLQLNCCRLRHWVCLFVVNHLCP
jgi:hypothetical protein